MIAYALLRVNLSLYKKKLVAGKAGQKRRAIAFDLSKNENMVEPA
jgi:hypothetical protein